VTVAIVRMNDCSWWDPGASALVPGNCATPRWFRPGWNGRGWLQALRLVVAGQYRLYVHVTDAAGNAIMSPVAGSTYTAFTIGSAGGPRRGRR
jgi:hypothetical protein